MTRGSNASQSVAKRAMDLMGAAAGLVLTAPLLIGTAAAIRVAMGRPVLFRQVRPGLAGRPFTLLKFRTMRVSSECDEDLSSDADRITPLGGFLRATSVDELPSLWNVVKGDMSLVGPRPLLMRYLERYPPDAARRHEVRPGITGWAQVNGRNALAWDEKLALDVWYVDHHCLWVDTQILLLTAYQVLARRGIGHGGMATMPEYRGPREESP